MLDLVSMMVSTLAGSDQVGKEDGFHSNSSFSGPLGLAVTKQGLLAVADNLSSLIRTVNVSSGQVETLAGNKSFYGYRDETGSMALFANPCGMAVTSSGLLLVTDAFSNRIRAVDPVSRTVSTIAGSGKLAFTRYGVFEDGVGVKASFYIPGGIAMVADDVAVIADEYNHRIRLLNTTSRRVTTLAGDGTYYWYDAASGDKASFYIPVDVAFAKSTGILYVADSGNNAIRSINMTTTEVKTVAGDALSTSFYQDGYGSLAFFNGPCGLAIVP